MIEPDQFDEKLAGGGSGPTICSAELTGDEQNDKSEFRRTGTFRLLLRF